MWVGCQVRYLRCRCIWHGLLTRFELGIMNINGSFIIGIVDLIAMIFLFCANCSCSIGSSLWQPRVDISAIGASGTGC